MRHRHFHFQAIPVAELDGRGAACFLFYSRINHTGRPGGTPAQPSLPCPSIHPVPLQLTTNFSSRPTFSLATAITFRAPLLPLSGLRAVLHTIRVASSRLLSYPVVDARPRIAVSQLLRKMDEQRRWAASGIRGCRRSVFQELKRWNPGLWKP